MKAQGATEEGKFDFNIQKKAVNTYEGIIILVIIIILLAFFEVQMYWLI